jgi:regulatory protein
MNESDNSTKALIQICLQFTALRMHSKKEIIDYLNKKTTDEEVINQVLAYFENNHLIDDREFAKLWAESRLKRGKGDLIIKSELFQKGVDKEIVSEILAVIQPEVWAEAILFAANKRQSKWLSLTGYERKAKLFQILRMRGFSGRHIDAFVRSRVE